MILLPAGVPVLQEALEVIIVVNPAHPPEHSKQLGLAIATAAESKPMTPLLAGGAAITQHRQPHKS